MNRLAPIALFVYNRPQHLLRTLRHLQRNVLAEASDLIVFSDGAKTPADADNVAKVRAIIQDVSGFRSVRVVERPANIGLAASVIDGVTQLTGVHGKVIVMEDDLETAPYFLSYMNDALAAYAAEERAGAVHGYLFPVEAENIPEVFFSRGSGSWGWGTWQRAWKHFEPDGNKLLEQLYDTGQVKAFNFDGAYPFKRMLRRQIKGKNDSWAIRWYASLFLKNLLTLHPGRSLVANIGHDASGTHCGTDDSYDVQLTTSPVNVTLIRVEDNVMMREAVIRFYKKTTRFWAKVKRRLKRIMK